MLTVDVPFNYTGGITRRVRQLEITGDDINIVRITVESFRFVSSFVHTIFNRILY